MHDFKPPKLSRTALPIANGIIPLALKSRRVRSVRFEPEDVERVRELRDERVVILPNHPTNTEPAIIFLLARQAGDAFHYVCCREAFDRGGGLWGKFIQRLGAYSLVRGALDRASFSMTRNLLAQPKAKVVIFPEGEVYSQNDSLLPFQSGVVQLAFWGLEDALRGDETADIKLLPVAVRYRFVEDMKPAIAHSISRLQKAVGISEAQPESIYGRIRGIGEVMVAKLEGQYGIKPDDASALGDRMDRIKRMQLERAAEIAGVKLKGGNLAEEMRVVVNAVHKVTHDSSQGKTTYDLRLWEEARNHIQPALHELDRLANWIAVYDGYVAADPSPERMVQLLVRMEQEVFGQVQIQGWQEAHVGIGDPISLAVHHSDYSTHKRETVSSVTKKCETSVQALLTGLAAKL